MLKFRWLGLVALLALGGCNTVHSVLPLFGPEDATGAPPLRPGLWLERNVVTDAIGDDECRFNLDLPLRKWPDCAHWVLIRERDILGFDDKDHGKAWTSAAYVLAGGRPRVLQVTMRDAQSGEDMSEYDGLVPTAHDSAGRITAFRNWDAQCGPRDHTKYPENSGPHPTTLAPLPGLVMEADGQSCSATDPEAVRRSVAASEAWDVDLQQARWVREARPDDFVRERRRK